MKQKVKEWIQEKPEKASCHHFWDIEVANGPSSIGTCRYCGEKKEFFNAFPTINPLKKSGNPLSLPRMPDVAINRDNNS
ncbi:MAG: hypothetical protein WC370_08725 [Dehalococcoidales bacterium]